MAHASQPPTQTVQMTHHMARDTSILSKWRASVCNTVIPLQLFRLHLQFDKHAEKTRYGTASMDSGLTHQLAPTSAARVVTQQKHETEFPDAHVFHFLDFIDRVKQNDAHHNGMTMIDFVQSMPFSQLLEKLKRQCDERSRRSLSHDSKTPNMQDLAILKGAKAAVALSIRQRFPVNTADAFMASKSRGQQPTTKKQPPGKPYDRPSAAHGAHPASSSSSSSSSASHDTTHLKLDATRDEIRREQEYLDRLIKAWAKYVRERLNLVPTHYRFAGNLYLCSKADDVQRQLDSYTWFQLPTKVPDYLQSCAHYPELGITPQTIEYPLYLSSRVRMWMQQKRHAELQNELYLQQCVPMDMIRSQFHCIEEQVKRAFQLHTIHELMRSGQQLQQCYDGILADQPSMHDIVDICSPLHLDVDAYVTLFFDLIDRAYHENVQVLMSEDEMASAAPAESAKFARKKQKITDFATHMAKIKLYTRDWTQSQLEYQRKQQRREQDELMASTSATRQRAPDDNESKYDNDANAAMSDEARESTAAPELSSTRDIRMQPFYIPVQAALYPDQFLAQFQEQQKQKQIPAIDVLHSFLDLKGCPAEEWIAIMDNATQQEAKAIPQLVSIFCKLYIKTQSVKWTMQLRMVLSQAAFAMRCLGPTHVLYSTVVAWHAQIFAMLQRIHPLGRDGETTSPDTILELKHQFRTVAMESATSRFAIERIRWLLALSTYAARLAELTNKSERNEFIMNATEEFGFLDHRWRHEAAALFDACFRHDKFKHAMDIVGTTRRHPTTTTTTTTTSTGAATSSSCADDDFAPLVKIGTWLHGEKACILGVSPPVSAASLPILTFLPTHTDETSFALRDTSLHADFDNAVASLRDTWLSRDIYFHGKLEPSGAANTNESEDEQRIRLHAAWLQWLKINSFEWQNDDLLRTHLSTLLARYTIAIKTCSEMNMTWPTSIIQLYSRQLSWLQRMQSGTPTTHWEEWMHHLLCFHVVMTWLDAAECSSSPSPAAASLSIAP